MHHALVMFDPELVDQEIIDDLKPWLQPEIAEILSSIDAVYPDYTRPGKIGRNGILEDIATPAEEILVTQRATHPTDVNVSPIQINIQAGMSKGRDGDRVVKLLGKAIRDEGIIPSGLLGDDKSCIFVMFHEYNGFGFIPKQHMTQGG